MTFNQSNVDTQTNWLYALGLFYFSFLYAITYHLLKRLVPTRVMDAYGVTLTMRLVGSLQSLTACASGLYIVSSCRDDIMKATCSLTDAFAKFCTFYFLIDLFVMYLSFVELNRANLATASVKKKEAKLTDDTENSYLIKQFLRRNKLMTFHHLVLPFIFVPCVLTLRDGTGDFFVGSLFLVEASSPFVNLRAVLRLLDYHETRLYFVNGVVMMTVFFACRVAIFPFLYQAYATFEGISLWAVPAAIPVKCNLGCILLLSMQIYWFTLMVKGLLKIIRSKMYPLRYQASYSDRD